MGPATAMDTFQTLSVHSRRHVSMHSAFQSSTGAKEIHTWHETTMPGSHDKTTTTTAPHGRRQRHRGSSESFTWDIWLKSAKPSALLKDPLPKGSKAPKGPASSTGRGRVTARSGARLLGPAQASSPRSPQHQSRARVVTSVCGVVTLVKVLNQERPPAPPGPLWLVVGAAQPDSLRPRKLEALSPVAGLPASIIHIHRRSDKPPMEGQTGPGVCPAGPGRGSEREGTAAHTAHVGKSSVGRDFC